MRVWHLISNRWNSAIGEYALSSARALRSAGANTLVTPLQASPMESRFNSFQFNIESVDHFGPSRYPKIASLAAKFAPDFIFTYGGPETTAVFFAKNRKKILRFYGQQAEQKGAPRALISRLGHIHVDKFLAPSKFVATPISETIGASVEVVSLGCDQGLYFLASTERCARPEILIFGRLDPVKGHREFMPIFREILSMAKVKGDPLPRLRIVGMPANLSALHLNAEADRLGLSADDVVIQCERVSNVAEELSRCSLGLVSSIGSEVICRVAQEFMMCGTPVVTSNVGSLPEVFVDRNFGDYFDYSNPQEAAAKVYRWLRVGHCETRAQRQLRASQAQGVFSLERMSNTLVNILEKMS